MLDTLTNASRGGVAPTSLAEAETAGNICEQAGWNERPTWLEICDGSRPSQPSSDEAVLGEWRHGWQYHLPWPS